MDQLTTDGCPIPELRTSDSGTDEQRSTNGKQQASPNRKIPETMHLKDCTGVHIGPLYNCIDPASVRTPPPGATSPVNTFNRDVKKRPPASLVESLLASEREMSVSEMDVVSKHLGYAWRQLGRMMRYSEGELDNMDADSPRLIDKGYSLLTHWRDRESKQATVANLTRLLMTAEAFEVVMHLRP